MAAQPGGSQPAIHRPRPLCVPSAAAAGVAGFVGPLIHVNQVLYRRAWEGCGPHTEGCLQESFLVLAAAKLGHAQDLPTPGNPAQTQRNPAITRPQAPDLAMLAR